MQRPHARSGLLSLSAALIALQVPAAHGDESSLLVGEGQMEVSVRCISLNRIKDTKVLSKKYIAFYTRDDAVYVNALPRKCSSLSPHKTFAYKSTQGRLCDLDTITVLDNFGSSFSIGPSCGLGKFTLTDGAGIERLKERIEAEKAQRRSR